MPAGNTSVILSEPIQAESPKTVTAVDEASPRANGHQSHPSRSRLRIRDKLTAVIAQEPSTGEEEILDADEEATAISEKLSANVPLADATAATRCEDAANRADQTSTRLLDEELVEYATLLTGSSVDEMMSNEVLVRLLDVAEPACHAQVDEATLSEISHNSTVNITHDGSPRLGRR